MSMYQAIAAWWQGLYQRPGRWWLYGLLLAPLLDLLLIGTLATASALGQLAVAHVAVLGFVLPPALLGLYIADFRAFRGNALKLLLVLVVLVNLIGLLGKGAIGPGVAVTVLLIRLLRLGWGTLAWAAGAVFLYGASGTAGVLFYAASDRSVTAAVLGFVLLKGALFGAGMAWAVQRYRQQPSCPRIESEAQ